MNVFSQPTLLSLLLLVLLGCQPSTSQEVEQETSDAPLKVLIIDGQNNHNMWPKTTVMMKAYLEQTGLFSVEVQRTAYTWKGEDYLADFPVEGVVQTQALEESRIDPDFKPDFSAYDVVVSNFGWRAAPWPKETRLALEQFVADGGGLVVVHAANNSWPEWLEFNRMIGLGGWGDRTEKDGPYVYYDKTGELVRDTSAGSAGSHGPQHEFLVTVRDQTHPITRDMPTEWLHAKDELYAQLRGPAENMDVLATAYSSPDQKGTDRHEPILLALDYGSGRVFHTTLGHADYSMEGVGFITSFTRGVEWAATGDVSQVLPEDFPTPEEATSRPFTAPE